MEKTLNLGQQHVAERMAEWQAQPALTGEQLEALAAQLDARYDNDSDPTGGFRNRDWDAVVKYAEDLKSGRVFSLCAGSNYSRRGYMAPLTAQEYGRIVATLGTFAREGDMAAQAVAALVGRVNLYGDRAQACAALYDAATRLLAEPYDDVMTRSGPESGRWSDSQKPWPLRFRVALKIALDDATDGLTDSVGGHAWPLSTLASILHVRISSKAG